MKRRKRQRGDHTIPHAIVKCGMATKDPGAQGRGWAGAPTIAMLALCAIVDGDGAARFDVPSLSAEAQTRLGLPAVI